MLAFFLTNPVQEPALTWQSVVLMVIVLASLVIAQVIGYFLRRQPDTTWNPGVIRAFNHRLRAYWMICAILMAAILLPYPVATVFLFFGVFLKMKEEP